MLVRQQLEILRKRKKKLQLDSSKIESRIDSPAFASKAPEWVLEQEKGKLEQIEAELCGTIGNISQLEDLQVERSETVEDAGS